MILFAALKDDFSGAPRVLVETIKAIDDDVLLAYSPSNDGFLEHLNVPKLNYDYERGHGAFTKLKNIFLSQCSLFIKLTKYKDRNAIKTVYVNSMLPIGAMLWGRIFNCRVILHLHESTSGLYFLDNILKNLAGFLCDDVIYVSYDQSKRFSIRKSKKIIIPNPIPSAFLISLKKNIRRVRKNTFRILMVCSPRVFKGVHEFNLLAEKLLKKPNIKFSLILNANKDEIDKFFSEKKISENITIYSKVFDLEHHYQSSDLLVNFSRVDLMIETFGLTLIEAFAHGLPVIAPPVGGPVEIVQNNKNGFLLDSRDTESIRKVIIWLAEYPDKYFEMSKNASLRAKDFSIEKYNEAIRKVLEA